MPLLKGSLPNQSFEEYYTGIGKPQMTELVEKLDRFFYSSIVYGLTSVTDLVIILEDEFIRLSYDGEKFVIYDLQSNTNNKTERNYLSFDNFDLGFEVLIQKMSNNDVWKKLVEFQ